MNNHTMLYNAPTSAKHSFRVNGTECAYINSAGIYINTVYLNNVLTTTNKPMQLFGYGNRINLATSNSNTLGTFILETK